MKSKNKMGANDTVEINDIVFSHKDIFNVVDDFYRKIEHDSLLKVPFQSVHDWPEHIERLTHFWWLRFGGKPYMFSQYNPVLKHFFAGFNETFLRQWLMLFHQTLDEKLNTQQAELWKSISNQMGKGLTLRNEMFKKHHEKNNKE